MSKKSQKIFKAILIPICLICIFLIGVTTSLQFDREITRYNFYISAATPPPSGFKSFLEITPNFYFVSFVVGIICFIIVAIAISYYIVKLIKSNFKIVKKQNSKESEQNNQDQVNN